MPRPVDPVSYAEAAHILGVTTSTVRHQVVAGRSSPIVVSPQVAVAELDQR